MHLPHFSAYFPSNSPSQFPPEGSGRIVFQFIEKFRSFKRFRPPVPVARSIFDYIWLDRRIRTVKRSPCYGQWGGLKGLGCLSGWKKKSNSNYTALCPCHWILVVKCWERVAKYLPALHIHAFCTWWCPQIALCKLNQFVESNGMCRRGFTLALNFDNW